jgi:hypothetical protein
MSGLRSLVISQLHRGGPPAPPGRRPASPGPVCGGRAGESGVLAKATVLEIVPAEGQHLQAAAHARTEAIFARDPEALRLFVPASSQEGQDAEPGGPDDGEDEAEAAARRAGRLQRE